MFYAVRNSLATSRRRAPIRGGLQYASLVQVVFPPTIPPVITSDPDDDAVIARAMAAHADFIVSGDRPLLALQVYQDIPIVTAKVLVARLPA